MTKEKMKQIHLIYSIVLSVMLCIAGICLMVACVGTYRSGDQPFSRQSVAAAFSPIAVPVLLCLGLIIIGFLLDLFLPKNGKKSSQKQEKTALRNRESRFD